MVVMLANWLTGSKQVAAGYCRSSSAMIISKVSKFYLIDGVVERTFGWFGRYRRLSKDCEGLMETSESMIYAAMTHLMVKRLVRIKLSRT